MFKSCIYHYFLGNRKVILVLSSIKITFIDPNTVLTTQRMNLLEKQFASDYRAFYLCLRRSLCGFFSEFADSTIMTIAHRLRTVVDYNRV